MANIKITDFSELLNLNQTGIYVPAVDTNDDTMDATGTNKKLELAKVVEAASLTTQGYFGVLTEFFFGGSTIDTTITTEQENDWVDVNFTPYSNGSDEGTFDYRPLSMKQAQPDGFDESTNTFTLEGLSLNSFITFEAAFDFEPEVDESQIEVRLLFQRHSGTSPSDDFEKTGNVVSLTQGADLDYSLQPLITAFIGDTIDTNGAGDAGTCRFQVKTTSAGIIKMKQLTWYLNK